MKSYDIVGWVPADSGSVTCDDCFDGDREQADPVFVSSEWDSYPTCDVCLEKIEDVSLTDEGLSYERRIEHEYLERTEDAYELTPEQQAYRDQSIANLGRRGLKFGVIYEFDLQHTEDTWIDYYYPWVNTYPQPRQKVEAIERGVWTKTEGDSEYEYDYLEGDWIGGLHRKYTTCLNKDDFRRFLKHTSLTIEDTETMGSIGGPTPDEPAGGISRQPAFAFRCDDDGGVITSAYVTPFWVGDHIPDDRDWDRIKAVFVNAS